MFVNQFIKSSRYPTNDNFAFALTIAYFFKKFSKLSFSFFVC